MKKIKRNAEKQIRSIFDGATKIIVHTFHNHYQGQEVELTEREIKSAMDDIKEGFAILFQVDEKTYRVQYAGKCFWKLIA